MRFKPVNGDFAGRYRVNATAICIRDDDLRRWSFRGYLAYECNLLPVGREGNRTADIGEDLLRHSSERWDNVKRSRRFILRKLLVINEIAVRRKSGAAETIVGVRH